MAKRLSGAWFKLVEPTGFYLGILVVPEPIAAHLEDLRAPVKWPLRFMSVSIQEMQATFAEIVPADQIMPGAIIVYGPTLSDLNKKPGFAFVPSADYLLRGQVTQAMNTKTLSPKAIITETPGAGGGSVSDRIRTVLINGKPVPAPPPKPPQVIPVDRFPTLDFANE